MAFDTIEALTSKILATGKPYDLELIREAYEIAESYHHGQLRRSGEPYIIHPLETAAILVDYGMDTESICAALMHDTLEDTPLTFEQIEKKFGSTVAKLVEGVTKLTKLPTTTRDEAQAENLRKMLLAMSEDIRVIIIKLADRLHNMRTIEFHNPQKRRDKALETMELYAPIASRLGIRSIQEELEDLSLRQLDAVGYQNIVSKLTLQKEERENFIETIKQRIREKILPEHPHCYLEGRVKSIFGIYKKMYMQNRHFEEIYDIYAVRVIVDTVIECYSVMGMIHAMFRPLPNRFKDYISTPKPNMYQSLHTTVVSREGVPFEVQIRTWDMHYTAEYGIAAHWKYKAGLSGHDKFDGKLEWIRRVIELQQDSEDPGDVVNTIKEFAPDDVFVFTPKGDVKSLPQGATVLDFAYAIHTQVGHRMSGAKVDGRIVPLDYQVKTGEIVEIITSSAQGKGPSRDWLNIARTSEARTKIRGWFKKERRDENIAEGREMLRKELARSHMQLTDEQFEQFMADTAKRQRFPNTEEFYATLGYGGLSLERIFPRMKEEYRANYQPQEPVRPQPTQTSSHARGGVVIQGMDDCVVKFAKCCNALPGDEIIGFVTRGFGVSIHKKDCLNVHLTGDPEKDARWVSASWGANVVEQFKTTLEIVAGDRTGLLMDLTTFFVNQHVQMTSLNARELRNMNVAITVTFLTSGIEQVKSIIAGVRKIQGVLSVERAVI